MVSSSADHWFMKEEYKWRTIASAFWTWLATFPISALFLFTFSVDPSRHIFILYDFVGSLLSVNAWLTCLAIASFTVSLVYLHSWYCAAVPMFSYTRSEYIRKTLSVSNLLYGLMSATFSVATTHIISWFISEDYSYSNRFCDPLAVKGNLRSCGLWFIFISFGLCVGIVNGADCIQEHKSSFFYPYSNEPKFLSFKCRFPDILSHCAMRSSRFLYYFLILYYIVGFVLKDVLVLFTGLKYGRIHSLQVWELFKAIPVVWNLWLQGMLLFLLWEVSWQLFNIYQTQGYSFLFDAYFPETKSGLLIENLDKLQPPIVQHLAYRYLSTITKQNPAKRGAIFALSRKTENGQPIVWRKVSRSCLNCIKQFTEDVAEYYLIVTDGSEMRNIDRNVSPSKVSEGNKKGSAFGFVFGHRPTSTHHSTSEHAIDASSSSIAVPAPRLWAMSCKSGMIDGTSAACCETDVQNATALGRAQKGLIFFANNMIKLPLSAYFFKTIPSWALLNIYQHTLVVHWAIQSLSYLCTASLSEDRFGVVQGNLHEVIICLVDLMKALEKLREVITSQSSVCKLHYSLHSEVKSSLHRIVDSYGDSLKSVNLHQQFREHLQDFYEYEQ